MSGFRTSITSTHTLAFGSVNNLAQTENSEIVVDNEHGYATIAMHVTAPTNGVVTFEASFNGITWEPITLRSIQDDIYTQTTDDNSDFIGSIAGSRKVRIRVTTAGDAAGTVIGSLHDQACVLEGIEFGYPPHRFGYVPVHKDASYTTAQTAAALWTPASGKKFIATDVTIIVGGTTDGTITIFDGTDAAGARLFKGSVEVATNKQFVWEKAYVTPYVSTAADNVLKITTTANMTVDVMVHGYEI